MDKEKTMLRVCGEPAPDRSGRSCDKPLGHNGPCWTYGGNTKTWESRKPHSLSEKK